MYVVVGWSVKRSEMVATRFALIGCCSSLGVVALSARGGAPLQMGAAPSGLIICIFYTLGTPLDLFSMASFFFLTCDMCGF